MGRPATSTPPPADAFLEIDGRRWRRSDPRIPATLRQPLVDELMAARRAVGAATSDEARRRARRRVQDAKVALGERGRAWWLDASPADLEPRLEAAILALLRSRREGATICPSDAARVAGGEAWRRLLPTVRATAVRLADAGRIAILRKGEPATGDRTAGVLRYRLAVSSSRPGRGAPRRSGPPSRPRSR